MRVAEKFITRCVWDALDADRPKAQVDSVMRTVTGIALRHMGPPRLKAIANDL